MLQWSITHTHKHTHIDMKYDIFEVFVICMCDFRIGKISVLLLFLKNNKTSLKGSIKHKEMSRVLRKTWKPQI